MKCKQKAPPHLATGLSQKVDVRRHPLLHSNGTALTGLEPRIVIIPMQGGPKLRIHHPPLEALPSTVFPSAHELDLIVAVHHHTPSLVFGHGCLR
jgi:hypothetical protein